MKTGLSTIQQTLTAEAATVLNQSIAEASRRNHGQTTPLHVAATLLSSPSGYLRQACIRSHPNSSHPLQCRALELCFSVALERLPTTSSAAGGPEPPISNALMAALKRAQAHQRRGCPEQNQQPLLAIKVELEQLIISILDDPSVSRVMREASFSSPAVKATIEQSLSNSNSGHNNHHHHQIVGNPSPHHELYKLGLCSPLGTNNVNTTISVPFPSGGGGGMVNSRLLNPSSQLSQPSQIPNRNLYLNPRLQQQQQESQPSPLPNRNMYLNPRLQQQHQESQPSPIANRNLYLNPRLQGGASGQSANQRDEQVKKVIDIMLKTKKRNPVLVGEGEPEAVVKELFKRIENGEGPLENVQVIPLDKELVSDKSQMQSKIEELGGLIETRIANGNVILDLGDLKWLVEQPGGFGVAAASGGLQQQQLVSEAGRAAVVEMGKLLARFGDNTNHTSNNKIWFIGTATCETYLRSQVYHPTMENDWDLQAVPIASRSPQPGMFPRLGPDRILGKPGEPLIPMKSFPIGMPKLSSRLSENLNPARETNCCPQCLEKYEEELGILTKESENSCSDAKTEAARPTLPQWLQNAKIQDNQVNGSDKSSLEGKENKELLLRQKSQELQKKWRDTCLRLHPNFHQNNASPAHSLTGLHNLNRDVQHQSFQAKLQATKISGETPRLNTNPVTLRLSEHLGSPPGSPVRTDLALGRKDNDPISAKADEVVVKDFLGCISPRPQSKILEKFANSLDADTYKKLLKGLMEKAWWQAEAASGVASAVTRCRLGNGKQRGGASRGDIWLLFTGPDRIGKRKMASVLAEQTCGASPVMINLGLRRDNEEMEMNFRGKTALDRITEAVRRNPFSLIMLEDIDEADMLVRGNIKRAIDRGRLTDSHGREISLGNVIFIVTGNWSTVSYQENHGNGIHDRKLSTVRNGKWQLRLTVNEKSAKRRASWLHNEDRSTKPRKEMNSGLSLDLNLAADIEDDRTDGSNNSSGLTIDHEEELHEELGLDDKQFSITSVPHELVNSVDDAIVFKPIDIAFIRREIRKTFTVKFSMVVDDKISLRVDDAALEKIINGLWHGKTSLEEWVLKVLAPSFDILRSRLKSLPENPIIQLALDPDMDSESCNNNGDQLPNEIKIMVD